ncbi:cytidylyltransferase domain-containing protein [Gracilibacillus dipsosauri]|uniref:acylneuraminate cytidylyltransferase family protein n=1 Tax=Gracilibacillus dipsosauri TaxID=178340 RepID=UPI00240972D6
MVKESICIIPARGNSKRIPNKNRMEFHGKPMLAWTILAAKESQLFDHIIVSTDNEKIAEISQKYGAEVPFLRKKHADDQSPVSLASFSALIEAEKFFEKEFSTIVQLMPNCPLRTSEDIRNSINYFEKSNTAFQISVTRYQWLNPWWALHIDKNNQPKPIFEEELRSRSQDLPELYCPTGAIWIAQAEAFKKEKTFYGKNYQICELDWESAIDIDTKEDLAMAELLMKERLRINEVN